MPRATEIEVRLAAPDRLLDRVAASRIVQDRASGTPELREQNTVYWDTPDHRFRAAGIALRVRTTADGQRTVSVKSEGPDLVTREEIEIPGEDERPSFAALTGAGWKAKKALRLLESEIVPVLVSEVRRRSLPLAFTDGTRAELVLDEGRLRAPGDGQAAERISEVEIELIEGDVRRILELACGLLDEVPGLRLAFASKAERGFAMLTGKPLAPRKARPPATSGKLSAGMLAVEAAAEAIGQIGRNVDGAAAGQDPTFVHQLRIGVRRYRLAMRIARTAGLSSPAEALMLEVKALWDTLAEVRDWDVFATETWPAITGERELADRSGIESAIVRARSAARQKLEAALAAPRLHQALLAMLWSLEHQRAEARAQKRHGARPLARKVLKKRQKRVCGHDAVLALSPEQRHRLRIDAKKLRYATEFFADLFAARDTRRFTARLADLQTDLGELNDLAMAPARLDAVLAGISDASARAVRDLWTGHERSRMAALRRNAGRTWKRFEKAPAFWR